MVKTHQLPVLIRVSPLPQAEKEFEKILKIFSNIVFIWAHFCSIIYKGINLEKAKDYLDRYPNLYTDISMEGGIKRYLNILK